MEKILTYNVTQPQRLGDFMRAHFSHRLATLIKQCDGSVKINGKDFVANPLLAEGDTVTVSIPERLKPFDAATNLDVEVLFKNEDYLVVKKPVGMPSIPTKGHYADNLIAALTYLYPNEVFRVVTRLDKDTSGLVLVALNALSHQLLSKAQINKKYTAELCGLLAEDVMVEAKILRGDTIKRVVDERGKPSKTHFKVLKHTDKGNTLCECTLFTGRTHQIRVHAEHIGHPIVGDELYGKNSDGHNSGQKLCCSHLSFADPFDGRKMVFEIKEAGF